MLYKDREGFRGFSWRSRIKEPQTHQVRPNESEGKEKWLPRPCHRVSGTQVFRSLRFCL